MKSLFHGTGSVPTDVGHLPLLARLPGTLRPRKCGGFWGQLQAATEDVFIFAVLVCSVHKRFSYENALYKFTFDIDIDIDICIKYEVKWWGLPFRVWLLLVRSLSLLHFIIVCTVCTVNTSYASCITMAVLLVTIIVVVFFINWLIGVHSRIFSKLAHTHTHIVTRNDFVQSHSLYRNDDLKDR